MEILRKAWSILLTAIIVSFFKDLSANGFVFKVNYIYWYLVPIIIFIIIPIVTHWNRHELHYNADWEILYPAKRIKSISDTVDLKVDILNRAKGSGNNQKGKYHLKGELNSHTMTLVFNGDGKYKKGHSGVVFLRKSADFGTLEGEWIQISSDDDILKGTVKMVKR